MGELTDFCAYDREGGRRLIREAFIANGYHHARTAAALGLSSSGFGRLVERHGYAHELQEMAIRYRTRFRKP